MLQRQKRQKSPSFIVKTPVKSIGEHRKVRELPRKMKMQEVEAPKNYENLQTKPVHAGRRHPENYENSQTKRTCKHETTKIAMKSVHDPSATSI